MRSPNHRAHQGLGDRWGARAGEIAERGIGGGQPSRVTEVLPNLSCQPRLSGPLLIVTAIAITATSSARAARMPRSGTELTMPRTYQALRRNDSSIEGFPPEVPCTRSFMICLPSVIPRVDSR